MSNEYTKDSIQFYDLRTGIRKKISMYLSANTPQEVHFKAFAEIWLNVVDEFNANKRSIPVEGWIYYDTKTHHIKVIDNSRGFPNDDDLIEQIVMHLHSGAKLDKEDDSKIQSYDKALGSNGAGLTIVNAISNLFKITSIRDNEIKIVEYKDGNLVSSKKEPLNKNNIPPEIARIPNYKSGAMIEAIIDPEIYSNIPVEPDMIRKECEWMTFAAQGLKFHLNIDGIETLYYAPRGFYDLLDKTIKTRNLKPIFNPIEFNFNSLDYKEGSINAEMQVILTFNQTSIDQSYSFINSHLTPENGTHVSGIKAAITMALNRYMQDNNKIPKKYEKMDVTGSIINDYSVSIISLKTNGNIIYSSQSKEGVKDVNVLNFAKSKFYPIFLNWLNENPKNADKLVNIILKEAEARYLAREAKNKVLGLDKKESFINSKLSRRLEDCLSKDTNINEVIIVEGESASVGSCRNSEFQAYYLLRGKVKNVMDDDNLTNEILRDFILMLNCGFGDKKDIRKLKYGKIILATDADDDGSHIASLLLAFFYKYYPELIKEGKVYLARPPYYRIITKSKKTMYIRDKKHWEFILVQIMLKTFNLISKKSNKILDEEYAKGFYYGLINYNTLLNNFAKQLNIPENLLELIVLHYKDIQNKNFDIFNKNNYKVKIEKETEYETLITFEEDVHIYYLTLNSKFYNLFYLPIINKIIKDIGIYNVKLQYKDDNSYLDSTLYDYSLFMDNLFKGKNIIDMSVLKGLGEMLEKDLEKTVVNPKTRSIYRVTMNDAEKAEKAIEVFMGKNFMNERKRYLETIGDEL